MGVVPGLAQELMYPAKFVDCGVASASGKVLVCGPSNLDSLDGAAIWLDHDAESAALSHHAAVLLTASWDGRAMARSLITGAVLWSRACTVVAGIGLCLIELHCDTDGNFVLVEAGRRDVVWRDPRSGAEVRRFSPRGKIVRVTPLIIDGASWYFVVTRGRRCGRHRGGQRRRRMYCVSPHGVCWSQALPGAYRIAFPYSGECVVLSLPERRHARCLRTGELVPVPEVGFMGPDERALAGRPGHIYDRWAQVVEYRGEERFANACYRVDAGGVEFDTWYYSAHAYWACDGWRHCESFHCRYPLATLWYAGPRERAQLELAYLWEFLSAAQDDSDIVRLVMHIAYEHARRLFRRQI